MSRTTYYESLDTGFIRVPNALDFFSDACPATCTQGGKKISPCPTTDRRTRGRQTGGLGGPWQEVHCFNNITVAASSTVEKSVASSWFDYCRFGGKKQFAETLIYAWVKLRGRVNDEGQAGTKHATKTRSREEDICLLILKFFRVSLSLRALVAEFCFQFE